MKPLTDESKMPFGKYKGYQMQSVPGQYLMWLGNELAAKDILRPAENAVFNYIEDNLDALEKEINK
jgi:hypothetical protein